MKKYPRTHHLEGSRLQPGDEDLESRPFHGLRGRHLVVEEKLDGANCGLSFDPRGRLRLQSRGHHLAGGPREKQFTLFKRWAAAHAPRLWERLGARYLVFGEWMYARHTVYYDALPHFFMEFDVWDREREVFLGTPERAALLEGLPIVRVPVLFSGVHRSPEDLPALVGPSPYRTPTWRTALREEALAAGIDPERALRESDDSDLAEGLYLKIEDDGVVIERLKWIRPGFATAVRDSGTHWMNRPILPNRLREGVDLWGERP